MSFQAAEDATNVSKVGTACLRVDVPPALAPEPFNSPALSLSDDKTVDDLNLSDLDLKKLKLSDEDALALSYLTPGLSKRIQQQLLAQLAPSEARKLSRTLSMRNRPEDRAESADRLSSTLPRRFSVETPTPPKTKETRSFLPVKSRIREEYSPEIDSKSSGYLSDSFRRTSSLREPKVEYTPSKSLSPTRYSRYSPESSSLTKYLAPNKYADRAKSEVRQPASKRVSRFLRPDFYETPKEENVYLKEKKEREMETQKVLKEIRDKRIKNRINLRRERSRSRDRQAETETDAILKNVSDNIKNLESSVKGVHSYVNLPLHNYVNVPAVKVEESSEPEAIPTYVNVPAVVKKERVSKLVRPKSYPVDGSLVLKEKSPLEVVPEKETKSKISRLKKATPAKKESPEKENRNRFLQSIEKKITKLRSLSNTPTSEGEEKKAGVEKKSSVENAIKRLREQSLPRNLDHITESGLIKRAVSVEDLTTDGNPKALQASRKSVTKILGLFKRYEERDKKKGEKVEKKPKAIREKNGASIVIGCGKPQPEKGKGDKVAPRKEVTPNNGTSKPERPKSLLLDQNKSFQRSYSGAKSDTTINDQAKPRASRLPVNAFRRSLNLDPARDENSINNNPSIDECNNRSGLTTPEGANRNSLTATDDSSTILSPCDDASCDSWSASSDYHPHELTSPVSPNGYLCSGDEGESVIDRIRRKSFYCRFNEKKRPRKSSYKDLDLYKELRKPNYRSPADNSYLDYRNRNLPLGDGCGRYQTYNPRIHGRAASIYSDPEDVNNGSDGVATGKSVK